MTPRITQCTSLIEMPSENCIRAIENVLERAKKGEVVSVAIVSCDRLGTASNEWAADTYSVGRTTLLGAIRLLEERIIRHLLDG